MKKTGELINSNFETCQKRSINFIIKIINKWNLKLFFFVQDDVARVIRAVQPDAVVLELCKARINILHNDEAKVQVNSLEKKNIFFWMFLTNSESFWKVRVTRFERKTNNNFQNVITKVLQVTSLGKFCNFPLKQSINFNLIFIFLGRSAKPDSRQDVGHAETERSCSGKISFVQLKT